MAKSLLITEKPSVAMEFAKVLKINGTRNKKNNWKIRNKAKCTRRKEVGWERRNSSIKW